MKLHIAELLATALPEVTVTEVSGVGGPWLSGGETNPPFRIRSIGDSPCLWHPERIDEIAADLDSAAPLLDAIEAVSGWRFEPAQVLLAAPHPTVALADGQLVVELSLDRVAPPPALLVDTASRMPVDPTRPLPRSLVLQGPVLDLPMAESLAPGDLLLLSPVLPALLPESGERFMFDLRDGTLHPYRWSEADEDGASRFAVQVSVALPPLLLSGDDITAVTTGETRGLGPPTDETPVGLLGGTVPLGTGLLVRLGLAFAIRIVSEEPAVDAAI